MHKQNWIKVLNRRKKLQVGTTVQATDTEANL